MERNFLVRITFDGLRFKGTQKQPDGGTVQDLFESLLSRLFREPVGIRCSSRLDAGVSARDFCFSFRHDTKMVTDKLCWYLSSQSPDFVRVRSVEEVPSDFDAKGTPHFKVYSYGLDTGADDPILDSHLWNVGKIDVSLLKKALDLFIGIHDFSSFAALNNKGERDQDFHSEIMSADIETGLDGRLTFVRLTGRAFHRYQIRMMIGAGIEVCKGKISLEKVKSLLDAPDIDARKFKAPGNALILEKTVYRKGGEGDAQR